MPQIRVGIKRDRREENNDRFAQRIRGVDRDIERRIIDAALGPLHPVDDARAFGIRRASSPHSHPSVLR